MRRQVPESPVHNERCTPGSGAGAGETTAGNRGIGTPAPCSLKTRPVQPPAKKDLGERLERAFSKYRERVAAVVKDATGDDLIRVTNLLKAQAAELIARVSGVARNRLYRGSL